MDAAESIFTRNHLSYVVSSKETLRGYLVEALSISGDFLDRFSVHDWTSALEHTLHCKPDTVPTEQFLKSQTLWIMYKMLIRIGLKEQVSAVMSELVAARTTTAHARAEFAFMVNKVAERLQAPQVSLFQVLDEFTQSVALFNQVHGDAVVREKRDYVDTRCEVIRWFCWVICKGGENWLVTATVPYLIQGFHKWKSEPPTPTLEPTKSTTSPSSLRPDSPVFSPCAQHGAE